VLYRGKGYLSPTPPPKKIEKSKSDWGVLEAIMPQRISHCPAQEKNINFICQVSAQTIEDTSKNKNRTITRN